MNIGYNPKKGYKPSHTIYVLKKIFLIQVQLIQSQNFTESFSYDLFFLYMCAFSEYETIFIKYYFRMV